MRYYPIQLDLQGRAVLVVGGGTIAEAKLEPLMAAGARVTVVSPVLTPQIAEWHAQERLQWVPREFVASDLAGTWLVMSATDVQAVNEQVAQAAAECNLLCNVVDQAPLCNFITPALVVRGDLTISISTAGGSPSVAQLVKRRIAETIGPEYAELLHLTAWLRGELKARGVGYQERRALLDDFLDSAVVDELREGNSRAADARAALVLQKLDEAA